MEQFQSNGPGKVFVNYGPMQMAIYAEKNGRPDSRIAGKGAEKAVRVFDALCRYKELARQNVRSLPQEMQVSGVLEAMLRAARATGDGNATPMLAVAGSIAQLTAERLGSLGATKATVNNGGDIALVLTRGQSLNVGVVTDMRRGVPDYAASVGFDSPIRGVATSGLGGRSFTQGIASAVVVFAKTASQADACATILGNATYVEHPGVHRVLAKRIDPNTDIPDLPVTTHVDRLPDEAVGRALAQAVELAARYRSDGIICGALIAVQGCYAMVPEGIAVRKVS